MSFRARRKPSRRAVTAASAAAAATLDALEPRRLLAFPATVTFAPGEWQTSFDVTAVDDLLPEPDEHYEMYVLPGSGYTTDPAWSRQSAIFASDTPNVWVEAAQPTATEGGQAAQVTFRRDNASGPLTARFGLTGDVADVAAPGVPDSDWLYPVTFADGQAAVTVPLSAIDDADVEPTEQVSAYLVSNAYGTAGVDKYFTPGDEARPSSAMASIADDDVNIEVEERTFTNGVTENLTIRTTGHDGLPKSTTVYVRAGFDDSVISPNVSVVTTGADGTAQLPVTGVGAGASALVLAADGGATRPTTQRSAPPEVYWDTAEGSLQVHVGESKTWKAVVVKAGGNRDNPADRLPNVPCTIKLVGEETDIVSVPGQGTTGQGGFVIVTVTGKKLPAGQGASVKVEVNGGQSDAKPVNVLDVKLTNTPERGQIANGPRLATIRAKVTDFFDDAQGIFGIKVKLTKVVKEGDIDFTITTADNTTKADGTATLGISANRAGKIHVKVEAIDTGKSEEIEIIFE